MLEFLPVVKQSTQSNESAIASKCQPKLLEDMKLAKQLNAS